jgi:hypothetical protein
MSTEAEKSPLLRSVIRKRPVKAVREDLACAIVICKLVEISDSAIIVCSYELRT